jgi:hypothetical protein
MSALTSNTGFVILLCGCDISLKVDELIEECVDKLTVRFFLD